MLKKNVSILSNLDNAYNTIDKSNLYFKDDEIFFPFEENDNNIENNTKSKSIFDLNLKKKNIINNSTLSSSTSTFLYENKKRFNLN